MAGNQTRFQAYLEDELQKIKGVYVPLKTGLPRRMLIRRASCVKLHPNPHDDFCDPRIGPSCEIISKYEKDIWLTQQHAQNNYIKEPLTVYGCIRPPSVRKDISGAFFCCTASGLTAS